MKFERYQRCKGSRFQGTLSEGKFFLTQLSDPPNKGTAPAASFRTDTSFTLSELKTFKDELGEIINQMEADQVTEGK